MTSPTYVTANISAWREIFHEKGDSANEVWLAARCFEPAGSTIRFAHTSPVHVEGPRPNSRARESAEFFIARIDRESEYFRRLDGFRDPAHRSEVLAFFAAARAVYASLLEKSANRNE